MSVVSNNILAGASGQGGAGYAIERSLRFNDADDSKLTKTFSSAGNRRKWTLSFWTKRTGLGTEDNLFTASGNYIRFEPSDIMRLNIGSIVDSTRLFRDPSAWYHIVWVWDTAQSTASNRSKVYVNNEIVTFSGYPSQNADSTVNNNVVHRIGAQGNTFHGYDGYIADVHFIDGQALAPTDFVELDDNGVYQPKKFAGTYGTNGFHLDFADNSSNAALGYDAAGSNNWTVNNLTANAIDYAATGSDPYSKISGGSYQNFWDGNTSTYVQISQGAYVTMTDNGSNAIGTASTNVGFYSSNGASTATLRINGSNVFEANSNSLQWYDFSFTGPIYKVEIGYLGGSGSSNNFYDFRIDGTTLISNPSSNTDSLVDTPTNGTQTDTGAGGEVVGNYATLNPLDSPVSNSGSLTNGNLNLNGVSTWSGNRATIAYPSSGKWYYEVQVNGSAASRGSNSQFSVVGICKTNDVFTGSNVTNEMLWLGDNGYGRNFSSSGTVDIFGANIDQGKIIGLAVNMDNNTFEYFVDGVSKQTGTINVTSGTSLSPFIASYGNSQTSLIANFGQRAFANSSVPSGFKALTTANLDPPTIADGSKYFEAKTYDGNSSARTFSDLSLSPDFVWIKSTSDSAGHVMTDRVRGVNKVLRSDSNDVENDSPIYGYVSQFGSYGFSLTPGTHATHSLGDVNMTGRKYVSWNWDAGDDPNPTTIAAGSLNSSAYDQSQTWSSAISTNSTFSLAATRAFDGDLTTLAATNNSTTSNILFTKTFTGVIKLRVYMDHGTNWRVRVNGGTWATDSDFTSTNASWRDITSLVPANGTVTSIESYVPSGVNNGTNWSAVEVNGKLLVDSGVSVPNVPSIASQVLANPTAGFSIIKASTDSTSTLRTVGHNLGKEPELIISKNLEWSDSWFTYHKDIQTNNSQYLNVNSYTGVASSGSTIWGHTSNVMGFNGALWVPGGATDEIIFYCFTSVEGYSKVSSYTGTASRNFIYTGFAPAWVLIKRYSDDAVAQWTVWDTARSPSNLNKQKLWLDASNSEEDHTNNSIDIVSNGFVLDPPENTNRQYTNDSGKGYIYLAFASHPFKTARAR